MQISSSKGNIRIGNEIGDSNGPCPCCHYNASCHQNKETTITFLYETTKNETSSTLT